MSLQMLFQLYIKCALYPQNIALTSYNPSPENNHTNKAMNIEFNLLEKC